MVPFKPQNCFLLSSSSHTRAMPRPQRCSPRSCIQCHDLGMYASRHRYLAPAFDSSVPTASSTTLAMRQPVDSISAVPSGPSS
jgi:hypothetical protein